MNTPETDANLLMDMHPRTLNGGFPNGRKATYGLDHIVTADFSRKLEDQRNVARVVAADAIREIERILETGDTYCTREIVANLKDALTPWSFLHNKCDYVPTQRTSTDCFSACLSWLLRLPQDEVPDFTDPEDPNSGKFYHNVAAWLNARGLRMMMIEWRDLPAMLGGPVIARGTSPREKAHAVLWDDDGLMHDPHPSRAGLVGEPTHAMLILSHNATAQTPPDDGTKNL